jgi:hypothetical protein
MDVNRIFTPEQIVVHPELPQMLKEYTKAAIKANPKDITAWSVEYFQRKMEQRSSGTMFTMMAEKRAGRGLVGGG